MGGAIDDNRKASQPDLRLNCEKQLWETGKNVNEI